MKAKKFLPMLLLLAFVASVTLPSCANNGFTSCRQTHKILAKRGNSVH